MGTLKKTSCALVLIAVLTCVPAYAQSDGAGQEGIKVHGDWTLTVRNPDGTIAAVHQFKNALSTVTGAGTVLARLLEGTTSVSAWAINLGTDPAGACGVGPNCLISQVSAVFPAHSTNLTESVPTTGPDAGKFVLRGSVRFVNAAAISVVTTDTNVAFSGTSNEFTRKLLDQLVAVAADQLVEVKVVISFS
jgi:hypothetical protein